MGEDTMTMTEEQMAQAAADAAMLETEEASVAVDTQTSVPETEAAMESAVGSETASQAVNPMTQQTQQMLSQMDGSTSAQAETHVPEASSAGILTTLPPLIKCA